MMGYGYASIMPVETRKYAIDISWLAARTFAISNNPKVKVSQGHVTTP